MGLSLMSGSIAMRYCEPLDRCGGLRLAQPMCATATSLFLSRAIHGLRTVVGTVCALHLAAVAVHVALPASLRKKPCAESARAALLLSPPPPCENNLLKQPGVLAQDGGPGRSHNTLCVAGGSTREGINSEPAKLECNFI